MGGGLVFAGPFVSQSRGLQGYFCLYGGMRHSLPQIATCRDHWGSIPGQSWGPSAQAAVPTGATGVCLYRYQVRHKSQLQQVITPEGTAKLCVCQSQIPKSQTMSTPPNVPTHAMSVSAIGRLGWRFKHVS